jgi:PAS domain S-box-containing protein
MPRQASRSQRCQLWNLVESKVNKKGVRKPGGRGKATKHRKSNRARSLSHHELRSSEIRYRRLFEAARDGILILDPRTRKITDSNPFLTELLGYGREEMLGKELWEIGLLKDEKANRGAFRDLEKNHFVRYENLPLQSKTGLRREVEFVSNLYEETGRKVIQCNIRDITERKHAQDEMGRLNRTLKLRVAERTVQLQASNKELQAFSYSVSHDLRAPLRHVLGFVDLLKKGLGPSLSGENLLHLITVADAAKRMGNLIDDLLSFSRFGRSSLRKTGVSLDDLVQEILGDFKEETARRQIAWDIRPLPPVWADRALLRLVLSNLISNAVKFTGGRAEAKIEIGCASNGTGQTVTFIRDNGAGFDPKYTEKLFGVFQRLHHQDEFEGTGIGLANVQRIIHRHGGRVWAKGILDGGATFFFSIPKQREARE